MKKLITLALISALTLGLAACSANTENTASSASSSAEVSKETVTITSLNGLKEEISIEVPYDPQKIAVLDMASLDMLDYLGLGDRVVGVASSNISYLQSYMESGITNIGTVKEANLEAVMSCKPDIIFIGGRLAESYDALSEIAPVVYISIDTEIGVIESVRNNLNTVSSIFGIEGDAESIMSDFDSRVEALREFAQGKNAIVGLVTSGSFNVLGNDGRCSIIGREIGFENLGIESDSATSTHGNEASFEYVLDKNPEYIFVLDRDSAIATEGAKLAEEIMENELIMNTDAYKNGNIVYLAHPDAWYIAEGGINALDIMLSDLETELLNQ